MDWSQWMYYLFWEKNFVFEIPWILSIYFPWNVGKYCDSFVNGMIGIQCFILHILSFDISFYFKCKINIEDKNF